MFEQDRMIMRLQQQVLADAEIEICFLAGSYGRRHEDAYSDLDVGLVFGGAAARDAAWSRRRAFVRAVSPYLPARSFDASHVRPHFHVALYGNGSKIDFRYEVRDQLQPTPGDRDLRLLKDSDGWGAAFQEACAGLAPAQPRMSAHALAALDDRFWIMFWDVLRVILRGDHQKPFSVYLELLYFTLPPLLHALPPELPTHQALLLASFSRDTAATAQHLRRLLHAYLAARTAVVERLQLDFSPDAAFEKQIVALVERLT